jgi:hypothetical protein
MEGLNNNFALAMNNAIKYYTNIDMNANANEIRNQGNIWSNTACNSLDWKTNGSQILAACRDSKGYMV